MNGNTLYFFYKIIFFCWVVYLKTCQPNENARLENVRLLERDAQVDVEVAQEHVPPGQKNAEREGRGDK